MHRSIEQFKADLVQSRQRHFSGEADAIAPFERVAAYTRDVDGIIVEIFTTLICPGSGSAGVCLIALGGYGRAELCPFSDIDLLILHEPSANAHADIAAAVRFFWDIGLTMGCVVRTIDECAGILGQDIASDTAFLENRFLAGHKALRQRLVDKVVTPYFSKRKKHYIDQMRRALRDQLYAPDSTLYQVEPDLKNGACTLRDCHRMVWAERLRVGLASIDQLESRSAFTAEQSRQFLSDYEFLLGLRASMHFLCGRRMDVMESALQPQLGSLCGFGADGAGPLMERFFKTVRSIKLFLLSYLEKNPGTTGLWLFVRRHIGSVEAAQGIFMNEGIFFMTHAALKLCKDPVWIMTVFKQAVLCHASFSVELRNCVRGAVGALTVDDFKSQEVGARFREILSYDAPVGHCLQLMHETGTLSRLIPQFADLTCKVEYDSYHEYTVDQHILMTLFTAEALTRERDGIVAELYADCPNRLVLRLGLLLHDIGKALPGDHVVNGAIIAETVCERLGLDEADSRRVRLLIYNHLDMSEFSLHREPQAGDLRDFAGILENRENLDMLFLLTVLDIRSVGRHTWTSWKAYQLEQLYYSLKKCLETPCAPSARKDAAHAADDPIDSYMRETIPEDRLRHEQWLAGLAPDEIQLHCDRFQGFERITVCGWDRRGFLRDVIGCFSSEGYNILNARIFSMPGNKVIDIFYVEPPKLPAVDSEKRIAGFLSKWNDIAAGKASADEFVSQRLKRYPVKQLRPNLHRAQPRVSVDNASSSTTTILEIRSADTFGLLHKIVQCLNKNGIDIRYAHLSTRVDQANDVFYVTDTANNKIDDEEKLRIVSGDIVASLQDGQVAPP